MSESHLITDEMHASVGDVLARRTSAPIDGSSIRRWLLAVHFPDAPPEQFQPATPLLAPEEFNPFAWTSPEPGAAEPDWTDPDHIEITLGIPGPGLAHMLNGGIDVRYGERMRVGDVVSAEERLVGYAERSGRLGRMLFTECEDSWHAQDGRWLKSLRTTLIRY